MKLLDIKTLQDVSLEYEISINTLKSRLKLTSFGLIEDVDFRRMGKGQNVLLTSLGIEKITKIKKGKVPEEFEKYYSKWKNKELTGVEITKLLNISNASFYRYIKEYESQMST